MWGFKKTISEKDYVSCFIYPCSRIKQDLIELVEELGFSGNRYQLEADANVFSVWVTSLALESKNQKDILHDLYSSVSFTSEYKVKEFFKMIGDRYGNFYFGYNNWVINPETGLQFGAILNKVIFEQNANFKAENELLVGDFLINSKLLTFSSESLFSIMDLKKSLLKKYKIKE